MRSNHYSTKTSAKSSDLVDRLRARVAADKSLPAERVLADELGVTRYQLRHALMLLRSSGELEAPAARKSSPSARGREALIRDTNPLEVIELRILLEPGFARLAALRATPQDISRLQKACFTPPDADRGLTDQAFHKLVASASGSTLIADFYNLLRQVGSDARLHVSRPTAQNAERIKKRDEEHRAIADAIAAREPDRAEAAMRSHLLYVQSQIMSRISPALYSMQGTVERDIA